MMYIDADKLYSTKGLTAKQREVRQLAINHLEAFIRLVAPYQLLAHCHIDLTKWIEENDEQNMLILWPRDHGKSRMAAFYAAWQIVREPDITIIYTSATAEKAEEQVRFIKEILTSKQVFKYFPGLINEKENERTAWNKTYIIVDHPARQGVVDSTIMTAGVEKTITGKHCRRLILDDVVVPENNNEEGRKKVNGWISQAASIMNADGLIFAVGTRYHPKDAYQIMIETEAQIMDENGEVVKEIPLYRVNIANVEEDGDFLWPRQMRTDGKWFGFNKEILAKKRAVYVANGELLQFYAQYYNDPNDKSTAPIDREFQYYDKKSLQFIQGVWYMDGDHLKIYCAVDLAASVNKGADYTAVVIGGIDDKGNRYLLEAHQYKTDRISNTIDLILRMYDKYRFRKLRIEAVAGFKLVAEDMVNTLRNKGMRCPVDFYQPNQFTVQGAVSKSARINGILEPLYKSKSIWHYRGGTAQMLEDELVMANPPHDDLKDAWAMCCDIMELPLRRHNRIARNKNVIRYSSRFGGVALA